MTRENSTTGTRTVDCNYCGTDTEPVLEDAHRTICRDCAIEHIIQAHDEDTHEVDCRECGQTTETAEQFESATCTGCLGVKDLFAGL